MHDAASGLTGIATDDLKKALAALHRGSMRCPWTIEELTRHGLQHCATGLLGQLRHLDAAGSRAVLVNVIAERLPHNRQRRIQAELKG